VKQDSSLEDEFVFPEDLPSYFASYEKLEGNEDQSFVELRNGTFCNLIPCNVLAQMTDLYVEDGWEGGISLDFKDMNFIRHRDGELKGYYYRHPRGKAALKIRTTFDDLPCLSDVFDKVLENMVDYFASFCPDLSETICSKGMLGGGQKEPEQLVEFFENMAVPLWDGTFGLYREAVLHWTGNYFLEKSEAIMISGGAYAFPEETIELHSGQVRLRRNLRKLDEDPEVHDTSKQPLLRPEPSSLKPTTDSPNIEVVQDADSQDGDEGPSNLVNEPPKPSGAVEPNRMEHLIDLESRLHKNLRAAEEAIDQCLRERDHTLADFAQLFAMRLQQHVVQSIQNGLEAVQLLQYFTSEDGSNSLPAECEARLFRYAHEAAKFHGIEGA